MSACGTCHECCIQPEIKGLKGWHERCPNLGPNGCLVYEERPDGCRKFQCGWLAGLGVPRPDEGGVIRTRKGRVFVRRFDGNHSGSQRQ